MDETSQKIIDAAMTLVRDKGYVATTTKEIARVAGVNECTLFRKFGSKKDIVLQGANQAGWRANVVPEIFENVEWDLQTDLEMFMRAYMDRMTPDFVNLSIGLRAPQLYEETKQLIMKVPQAFLETFTDYLNKMCEMGKIPEKDFKTLALTVFSATFGYTFLNASFGNELTDAPKEEYIKESLQTGFIFSFVIDRYPWYRMRCEDDGRRIEKVKIYDKENPLDKNYHLNISLEKSIVYKQGFDIISEQLKMNRKEEELWCTYLNL